MNHDFRYLKSLPPEALDAYINHCMSKAYAEARNSYRAELQRGLEIQADNQERVGVPLRLPLPVKAEFHLAESRHTAIAECITWVEFTPDQIRSFSHFLTGIRS